MLLLEFKTPTLEVKASLDSNFGPTWKQRVSQQNDLLYTSKESC